MLFVVNLENVENPRLTTLNTLEYSLSSFFFFFLAALCGSQDLSSPVRD